MPTQNVFLNMKWKTRLVKVQPLKFKVRRKVWKGQKGPLNSKVDALAGRNLFLDEIKSVTYKMPHVSWKRNLHRFFCEGKQFSGSDYAFFERNSSFIKRDGCLNWRKVTTYIRLEKLGNMFGFGIGEPSDKMHASTISYFIVQSSPNQWQCSTCH